MATLHNTSACAPVFAAGSRKNAGILSAILRAHGKWRQRQALAKLDSHLLDDIGLTEEDVQRETRRNAWDAPGNWLR